MTHHELVQTCSGDLLAVSFDLARATVGRAGAEWPPGPVSRLGEAGRACAGGARRTRRRASVGRGVRQGRPHPPRRQGRLVGSGQVRQGCQRPEGHCPPQEITWRRAGSDRRRDRLILPPVGQFRPPAMQFMTGGGRQSVRIFVRQRPSPRPRDFLRVDTLHLAGAEKTDRRAFSSGNRVAERHVLWGGDGATGSFRTALLPTAPRALGARGVPAVGGPETAAGAVPAADRAVAVGVPRAAGAWPFEGEVACDQTADQLAGGLGRRRGPRRWRRPRAGSRAGPGAPGAGAPGGGRPHGRPPWPRTG